MSRIKKTPEKPEAVSREQAEEPKEPVSDQGELPDQVLESVTGGVESTGLQNPLDATKPVFYF